VDTEDITLNQLNKKGENMIICEVKQGYGKYVFASKCKIKPDTWVMCDTRYGNRPGLVTECFEVEDTNSKLYKRYLDLLGATEPLKEVIGVYIPLEYVTEMIRKRKERKA
jgi:hypothetical protein